MFDSPFAELNLDDEVKDLQEKRSLNVFYKAMKKEFDIHASSQKKLPRRVQKIHYTTPILFLPKSMWRIDTSRGFTKIRVNGQEESVTLLSEEGKECLYTAELDIYTNRLGVIEKVEYVSFLKPGLLYRTKNAAKCVGDIMTYHQTTTMTHLRSIYMGLFEPYGANRFTADSIIMLLLQAIRDGRVELSHCEFGLDGYIQYNLDNISGERYSALFDFRNLYKIGLNDEQ
nr:MAG TPA: hypothetical protein [Caudoviricetes sp.]